MGNFDIYAMNLDFLKKPYLAQGANKPQHEAVYNEILTWQAKPDYTGRCYLSSPTTTVPSRFESRGIRDPMEETPFDIVVHSVKRVGNLTFTQTELATFASPTTTFTGPGITGALSLAEAQCGIQSSSGTIKMHRVWSKPIPQSQQPLRTLRRGFILRHLL